MTTYYLLENGIISQSASFKFNDNCIETEEEIARKDDGTLVLKTDYDNYIQSDDYKTKIAAQEKAVKITDLNAQIDAIDKKRVRAIAEPSIKDSTSGQTYLEYYTAQVQALRAQIAAL